MFFIYLWCTDLHALPSSLPWRCPDQVTLRGLGPQRLQPVSGGIVPHAAAVGVQVEDAHAVRQAEPGVGAALWPRAVAVEGAQHQPLAGLIGGHQRQALFGITWRSTDRQTDRGGMK